MNLRQNKGFSALQALVSTGVVVGIALTTLASFNNIQKSQNRSTAGVSRGSIASVLSFNASSPLSLYNSSEYSSNTLGDHRLRACMCGETTCKAGTSVNFNLLDVGGAVIAGSASDKRLFNLLGNYCDSGQCIFEADTNFSCVGSNCGTYKTTATDPLFRINYRLYLTSGIADSNNEYAYLKDAQETVDVPIAGVRRYGLINDLCVTGNNVSPTYGLSSGGEQVTISGTGLQRVSQVLFDNSVCSIIAQSKKSITCITPGHADGYVNVTLRYPTNQAYTLTNAFQYYTPPPPPPPDPPPSSSLCTGTWSREAVLGPCGGAPHGACSPCGAGTQACGAWFSCDP